MKMLAKLALRNLRRNQRQTALMVTIVAVGTWSIVVIWGLTDGSIDSMLDAQISLDTGALQLHQRGYLDDPNLNRTISPPQLDKLDAVLKRYGQVDHWSPRLNTEGLLKSAYGSTGVGIRGVDPLLESAVTQVAQKVVNGRYLAGPSEVLLGRALAEKLDVRLGERVVLQAQGLTRAHALGLRLVGIFQTGLGALDQATVFVHLEDAQSLTQVQGASEIAVSLKQGVDARAFAPVLQAVVGNGLEVSSYDALNPLVADFVRISHVEMMPTMLLLSVLAGFGVANTITFTVFKRIREFGVILALGLRPKQLSRMVVLESLFISGIGFVIGSVLGYALNFYLQQVGIDYGFYSDVFPDLGVPQVLYAKVKLSHSLYALAVVVFTALVAARYPARRAAKLQPTEAMRYV